MNIYVYIYLYIYIYYICIYTYIYLCIYVCICIGVLSMANSGERSNGSQFFLTLKNTSHLDYKHSVFGKLVGGAAVLDRIEAVGADKKEKPLQVYIYIYIYIYIFIYM
jgi:hypothetical protein